MLYNVLYFVWHNSPKKLDFSSLFCHAQQQNSNFCYFSFECILQYMKFPGLQETTETETVGAKINQDLERSENADIPTSMTSIKVLF